MGALERRKGKLGEQEVARLLRPLFPDARSRRSGQESEQSPDRGRDLAGTPGWCWQVQLSKSPNPLRKFREAASAAKPHEIPVAATRRTQLGRKKEWLVTMRLDDLIKAITYGV